MRALVLALALVACGKKHETGAPPPPKRDAAPIEVDWARCEKQVQTLVDIDSQPGRVEALIDACPVCGDWKPVLEWNTLRTEGGPTRDAIADRMSACNAWCETKAKDFFIAALDDARGQGSRAPWKHLAEICKDKVSAVPDGRFESAPYFALDRIGRAVAAHGGPAADQLAKFSFVLPPVTPTGSGIEVSEWDGATEKIPDNVPLLTVLGDQLYVAPVPMAHATATGVQLLTTENYPGHVATPADISTAHPEIVVIAARGMPAKQLLAMLAKTGDGTTFHLAVRAKTKLVGWPAIAMIPLDLHAAVDAKATVQDAVKILAKR
jgi:hypothetical protein